ncbi:uncharacterized protein LOC132640717 isoform X2 [Lycium barbarum]|uniref:uncharacterized protein LOC132640717 isoform X2 n=1 Tax=Lycium barbarum TaxID=112863 RepID=UPI00293E4AB9|nr:uncharacterized protein LOC132640717 isoform X2 [Lycium barbarum]
MNVVVPDGYSSNILRCVDVKQRRLFGLKSHDCHILMQQLLPIALRNALHGLVSAVLADLSSFFRQLCSKVLNPMDLDNLQNQITLTLCHLEMIFPPSFFTVMVHLVVHLVDEVRHGGPVHYRWMYPIERFLGHLKSFVRNMAQPEGSIAEGYLVDEILTFCSRYFEDVKTRMNRPRRVDDKPDDVGYHEKETMFPKIGKSVASSYFKLPPMQKQQAHRHVLINCPAVDPFIQEFRTETKRRLRSRTRSESTIDKIVHKEFVSWFQKRQWLGQEGSRLHHLIQRSLLQILMSMPPTHGPEHASSESDSSDDDDVPPTSSETTASKKKRYWIGSLIDEGGTITEGRLKLRDIWSLPTGKRIIILCNELGQPIDDVGGLLGGFMGDLGFDFSKFPMCYKSWRKVPVNYKNSVYDDIIQKKILVEDGRLRDYMMKSIGKTWKNTRCSLYHRFYKESLTFEENVARRPGGIDLD